MIYFFYLFGIIEYGEFLTAHFFFFTDIRTSQLQGCLRRCSINGYTPKQLEIHNLIEKNNYKCIVGKVFEM